LLPSLSPELKSEIVILMTPVRQIKNSPHNLMNPPTEKFMKKGENRLKFLILKKEQPNTPYLLSAAILWRVGDDILSETPRTPGPRHGIYFE
jgi:hypothetical protein